MVTSIAVSLVVGNAVIEYDVEVDAEYLVLDWGGGALHHTMVAVCVDEPEIAKLAVSPDGCNGTRFETK